MKRIDDLIQRTYELQKALDKAKLEPCESNASTVANIIYFMLLIATSLHRDLGKKNGR